MSSQRKEGSGDLRMNFEVRNGYMNIDATNPARWMMKKWRVMSDILDACEQRWATPVSAGSDSDSNSTF